MNHLLNEVNHSIAVLSLTGRAEKRKGKWIYDVKMRNAVLLIQARDRVMKLEKETQILRAEVYSRLLK